MSTYEITDFQTDVIDRSATVPVVADFWADWCGPCKALSPILEKLAAEAAGAWQLAKIDTEAHPGIAASYGIRSIPAVKLFVDGLVTGEFVGALPEEAAREWLGEMLPGASADRLREARDLLEAGDPAGAAAAERLLREVLAGEPGNAEARVLLAQAVVFDDPSAATTLLEPHKAGSKHDDRVDALRTIGHLLSLFLEGPRPAEGPATGRYMEAIAALAKRDFEAALAAFVEVVAVDRTLDDDGARRACVAIFELLGAEAATTREYRRALSSALFS